MTMKWTAAGIATALLALVAAAPGGLAGTSTIVVAQADDATAEANALIAETANIASMSDEDLKAKLKAVRKLLRNESVQSELKPGLQEFQEAVRKELVTRQAKSQQPAEQPAAEQAQPEQQPAAEQAAPAEQPAEQAAPAEQAPAAGGDAQARAQAILADAPNLKALSDEDLKARIQEARRLLRDKSLENETKPALQSFVQDARQELAAREANATQQPAEQPAAEQAQPQTIEPPAEQPAQTPAADVSDNDVAAASKLLADQRKVNELSEDELKQRIDAARQLARKGKVPDDVRDQLRNLITTSRQELLARQSGGQGGAAQQAETPVEKAPAPPPSEAENRAVDKPKVSAEAEAQAKTLLAEGAAVEKMSDDQLRARLERLRDVLEEGNISRETERDLRNRLKEERQILRARVAARDLKKDEETQQGGQQAGSGQGGGLNNGPVEITRLDQRPSRQEMDFVVKDRRRLRELSEFELKRRIFVFRELMRDDRYTDDQLLFIRGELDKSRAELRRRFEEDKVTRRNDFERRRKSKDLDVDINIVLAPQGSRPRPPVIWAAEEDEEEIEQQLAARPVHRLPKRYSRDELYDEPEVVLSQPEVRDALPGVEIDTINFGFNEAFVREEEVENLEVIATTIERIVAAHPNEVFVIEGHTDAVGSDAYNLGLSRQRAQAVRKILLEFYNIEQDNIIAVGLGERYLKIPTPEPEQENRRVTVRRATPLLSDYDADAEE